MLNNLTDCEDGDGGASQGKGQPEGVGERRPGAAGPQPRGRGQSRELRGAAEARGGGLRPRRRLLLGGRATPRCGSGRCPRRAPRGCGCAGGAGGPAPAAGGGCGFPRRRPRAEPPPPPARPAPRPQLPQSRGAAGPDRALRGASPRGRGCAPASVPSRAAPGGAAPSRSGRAAAETSATAPSRLPPPALPTRCLSAPPPASPPTLPSRPQPSSLPTPPAAAFGPGPPSPPPPLLAPPPPPPRRPGPALPLSAVLKPCAVQPPGPPRRRAGAADPRGALGLPGRSVRCSKAEPSPPCSPAPGKAELHGCSPRLPSSGANAASSFTGVAGRHGNGPGECSRVRGGSCSTALTAPTPSRSPHGVCRKPRPGGPREGSRAASCGVSSRLPAAGLRALPHTTLLVCAPQPDSCLSACLFTAALKVRAGRSFRGHLARPGGAALPHRPNPSLALTLCPMQQQGLRCSLRLRCGSAGLHGGRCVCPAACRLRFWGLAVRLDTVPLQMGHQNCPWS